MSNSTPTTVEEPSHVCSRCHDRGIIMSDDGGAGGARQCGCRDPATSDDALRAKMVQAGLQHEEISAGIEAWEEAVKVESDFADQLRQAGHQVTPLSEGVAVAHLGPTPEWAFEWLDGALQGKDQRCTVTLLGNPGTGKTKTAALLVARYFRTGGKNVIWARASEALDKVMDERRESGRSDYESRLKNAELTVLDEFGLQSRRDETGTRSKTLSEWVQFRHRRKKLTILTSNARSLRELGDPRLESRLAEGSYRVLKGLDFRDLKCVRIKENEV